MFFFQRSVSPLPGRTESKLAATKHMTHVSFFTSVNSFMFSIRTLETFVGSYVFYCKVIVLWFTGSLYVHCELTPASSKYLTARRHIMCIVAMQKSSQSIPEGRKPLFVPMAFIGMEICKSTHRLSYKAKHRGRKTESTA